VTNDAWAASFLSFISESVAAGFELKDFGFESFPFNRIPFISK